MTIDSHAAVPTMPTCPNCGPQAERLALPCLSRTFGECALDGPRHGPPGGGMAQRRDFHGRIWTWMGWRWVTRRRPPGIA